MREIKPRVLIILDVTRFYNNAALIRITFYSMVGGKYLSSMSGYRLLTTKHARLSADLYSGFVPRICLVPLNTTPARKA